MNQIRHILLCFTILLLSASIAKATHYRAGEINYRYIGINNFEIIVITYTDPANTGADRKEMEVFFGDNKSEIVPRSNGNGEIVNSDINNTIKKNIYRTTHSYPGPGNYIIRITDPNRIDGIKNINGGRSVDIAFYVESVLTIAAGIGNNQSPILLLPPIDVGCVNEIFTHNPAAYDPDGDSLAFTIIAPKMAQGMEVPRFTIPQFSDSFNISVNNGQLTWHKPVQEGFYNWAIRINEYRGGILIGYVVRDMQVYINNNCDNSPPKLTVPQFTCLEANQLVQGTISANDSNSGQRVKLQYYGSPFVQKNSPATLTPTSPEGPSSGFSATFNWQPSCNAIKYYPHIAVFRAVDNHVTKPLADIKFWNIKVVGPSPKNVRIVQDSNGFILNWNRDTCKMAFGYKIYRKIDSSYWKHAKCETGVPEYSKFSLYDTTRGLNNTTYFDNNGGKGISPLIRYCYLITSWYYQRNEDGIIIVIGEKIESYASDEVCAIILKTKPIITKVSVEKTGTSNGMININWIKPEVLDPTQNKPPYQVQLQRSTSALGVYQNIGKAIDYPSYASLKDESVDDSLLNTANTNYYYRVMMYGTKNGTLKLIETSNIAGSPRLSILNTNRTAVLNWKADVPWINKQYIIYKKNALNTFDSITSTKELFFADTGLINGNTYCYFIETKGNYDTLYYPFLIRNKSQEACGIPIDTIRPCAPILTIDTPCNSFTVLQVKLNWLYPETCEKDVVKYRIYWKKNVKESWEILDSVLFSVNQYIDDRIALKLSIAGCYVVVAVDSFNNESYFTNEHCINNCPFYDIPNVFTPNGDGKNDYLIPFPYRFIDKVDLIIYNRWGQEVFVTNNIDIYWNGNDQKTGNECSEGVYFFIADVYESYLEGTKKRNIRGAINIIR